MTSTATIELESPQQPPSPQPTAENFGQTDNVVAQSQLADSTVPDGEYGWVIVFACSVLAFWFIGTTYCWGVVQAPLVQEGLASASTLSFVGSLAVAANSFFAIMSARIMQRIGTRWTAVIGVSILSAGELFAGFATHSVGGLFATAGVTLGVGVSLCFAAVSTVTAQYFYRKRGLANGLVFAGGGLGGAIISFAMNTLIDRLGVAWTFRVIGFLQLATGLPAAMLIKERARVHRNIFIEWSLFKDLTFILIFVAGAIATFPLFVPPFFLPLYARSVGLSSAAGAGLVAGFNFASALGRVGFGMMADKAGPLNSLFIGLALCATSMLVMWPVSDSLAPLILFVLINGAANGSFFATMPTVVGNLFGSIRVAVAMGMVVTSWGGGYLMGAPIAGYILDAYGGPNANFTAYRPAIFYSGGMAVGAAAMVASVRLRKERGFLKKA